MNNPLLQQVQIRNYKNIASVVVDMRPLTVLVGPNGAGKSNFVDALTFVADSLNYSVSLAFANRGGIAAVRRRSGGHPTHVGMRFRIVFPCEEELRGVARYEAKQSRGVARRNDEAKQSKTITA